MTPQLYAIYVFNSTITGNSPLLQLITTARYHTKPIHNTVQSHSVATTFIPITFSPSAVSYTLLGLYYLKKKKKNMKAP
jgi:hypothetical protein